MRLKKGFTLAEILIVLVTIGIIATLTIPSMMNGVRDSQYKTAYKKAYNAVANTAAIENVAGTWPAVVNDANLGLVYRALNNSLSVKGYATQAISAGTPLTDNAEFKSCLSIPNANGGVQILGTGNQDCAIATDGDAWLITEDNIAYAVTKGAADDSTCLRKQAIAAIGSNEGDTEANIVTSSCFVVTVDVDGLAKGNNSFANNDAALGANNTLALLDDDATMNNLVNDQFKIYLGNDGASAGHRTSTITGRIMADLK